MNSSLQGILSRPRALGIGDISFDIYRHPERDPGCFKKGADFLRTFSQSHSHCMLIFDHHGCGDEKTRPEEMENKLEKEMSSLWENRCAVIAIAPELENWVWSESPHVDQILGWAGKHPSLREWMKSRDYWPDQCPKPPDPKGALEAALWEVRKQRSSSIYFDLAKKVSFDHCQDRAFKKLRAVLKTWF